MEERVVCLLVNKCCETKAKSMGFSGFLSDGDEYFFSCWDSWDFVGKTEPPRVIWSDDWHSFRGSSNALTTLHNTSKPCCYYRYDAIPYPILYRVRWNITVLPLSRRTPEVQQTFQLLTSPALTYTIKLLPCRNAHNVSISLSLACANVYKRTSHSCWDHPVPVVILVLCAAYQYGSSDQSHKTCSWRSFSVQFFVSGQ